MKNPFKKEVVVEEPQLNTPTIERVKDDEVVNQKLIASELQILNFKMRMEKISVWAGISFIPAFIVSLFTAMVFTGFGFADIKTSFSALFRSLGYSEIVMMKEDGVYEYYLQNYTEQMDSWYSFLTAFALLLMALWVACFWALTQWNEDNLQNIKRKVFDDKHIRGNKLYTLFDFQKLVLQHQFEKLTKDVPGLVELGAKVKTDIAFYLSFFHISMHVFFGGSTGSGKSTWIKYLLHHLEKKDETNVILHDIKPEFIKFFYKKERFIDADGTVHSDVELNPLSADCVHINWFNDINDGPMIQAMAYIVFPAKAEGENFFENSARIIFAGLWAYCLVSGNATNKYFSRLKNMDEETLVEKLSEYSSKGDALEIKFIQGAIVQLTSETGNGFTNFVNATAFLDYWAHLDGNFSLRKWARKETKGWVFLTQTVKYQQTLAPTFALTTELLSKEFLTEKSAVEKGVKDTPDRENNRIWLILDEAAMMSKINSLSQLLALGRSYGISVFIGAQVIDMFEKIYGREETQNILGNTAVKLFMNLTGKQTKDIASESLGEVERYETTSSYGVEAGEAKVNSQRKAVKEPLVSPSQLEGLQTFQAYLSVKGVGVTLGEVPQKFDMEERHPGGLTLHPRFLPYAEQLHLEDDDKLEINMPDLDDVKVDSIVNIDDDFDFEIDDDFEVDEEDFDEEIELES